MKARMWSVAVVLVVGLLCGSALAEGKKVELDKVPAPVMEAAKAAVANITVKEATMMKADYVLKGAVEKTEYVVTVSAEAKVLCVEEAVDVKAVPEAVMKAAVEAVKGLEVKSAAKVTEGDKVSYKLMGGKVTVKVSADGKVLSVTEAVEVKDIPKAVMDAAMAAVKGLEVKSAKKVTEGEAVSYKLMGTAEGKEVKVVVGADGKVASVEKEEAAPKAEVKKTP